MTCSWAVSIDYIFFLMEYISYKHCMWLIPFFCSLYVPDFFKRYSYLINKYFTGPWKQTFLLFIQTNGSLTFPHPSSLCLPKLAPMLIHFTSGIKTLSLHGAMNPPHSMWQCSINHKAPLLSHGKWVWVTWPPILKHVRYLTLLSSGQQIGAEANERWKYVSGERRSLATQGSTGHSIDEGTRCIQMCRHRPVGVHGYACTHC